MQTQMFHILLCHVGGCERKQMAPTMVTACCHCLDITLSVQTHTLYANTRNRAVRVLLADDPAVPLTLIEIMMSHSLNVFL